MQRYEALSFYRFVPVIGVVFGSFASVAFKGVSNNKSLSLYDIVHCDYYLVSSG